MARRKMIDFVKMHGLGNDFVIVHNQTLSPDEIRKISDRRLGVGCDQLLNLIPSAMADIEVRIYNADGSVASACGNAMRCVAKLLATQRIIVGDRIIETEVMQDAIRVKMGAYSIEDISLSGVYGAHFVDVGNPHIVLFGVDASEELALDLQNKIRGGVNVEFVSVLSHNSISVKVWERGVGWTKACGTGACAAAAVGFKKYDMNKAISVKLEGGTLEIEMDCQDIYMSGSAEFVFEGKYVLHA